MNWIQWPDYVWRNLHRNGYIYVHREWKRTSKSNKSQRSISPLKIRVVNVVCENLLISFAIASKLKRKIGHKFVYLCGLMSMKHCHQHSTEQEQIAKWSQFDPKSVTILVLSLLSLTQWSISTTKTTLFL